MFIGVAWKFRVLSASTGKGLTRSHRQDLEDLEGWKAKNSSVKAIISDATIRVTSGFCETGNEIIYYHTE